MDKFLGDLTDIIRASGASYGSSCSTGTTSSSEAAPPFSHDDHHWHFSSVLEDDTRGNFGDPFSNTRDPFLHELHMLGSAYYFDNTNSAEISSSKGLEEAGCFGGGVIDTSNSSVLAQEILEDDDDDMRRPCNSMLLNMTQISANANLAMSPCHSNSPVTATASPSAMVSGNVINANISKDHCLMNNTGVQISSPRNPGLKRRKNQSKKSICISAPTAPNNTQSGEVVPSDLWAWRKYGQKPIKDSPYPRAYYRCSSSKGCPARKQVERSRTDPNMLVITYTSEHNHAWPTQRNALSGSTRSQLQPSKKNNANSKSSETNDRPQTGTTKNQEEEEQQEISNSDSNMFPTVAAGNSSSKGAYVKQQLEMEDGEFSNGLPYKASKLKCNQLDDFLQKWEKL